MDDVHEIHNARVVKLLQQRHLTNGSAGNTLVRVLDFDFLYSDNLKKKEKVRNARDEKLGPPGLRFYFAF